MLARAPWARGSGRLDCVNMDEGSALPVIAGLGPSLYLELPAILAGSLSGAAHAVRKGFDASGIFALATATGLGGGILRDLVLGHTPPLAFIKPSYLHTALASAIIAFFFARAIARIEKLLQFIDALALGFFATVGAQQALAAHLSPLGVVFIGVLTAIGGSVLRDLLSNEVPVVLTPSTLYATVAALSVIAYAALRLGLHTHRIWAETAAIGTSVLLRQLAASRDWRLPPPRL